MARGYDELWNIWQPWELIQFLSQVIAFWKYGL